MPGAPVGRASGELGAGEGRIARRPGRRGHDVMRSSRRELVGRPRRFEAARPTPPRPAPLLEAVGLSAGYGRIVALSDVALVVPERATVALIGANGAGKSTLLKVLSGAVPAWSGRVTFEGRPVAGAAPWDRVRRGLYYLPEGGGLFNALSVRDNLRLAHELGRAGEEDLERVVALFPVLAQRRHQRAGTLSGGEKRMLALGRAILARPRLLLVDEPSLGLAPMIVDQLFEVLAALRRDEGISLVVVEQHTTKVLEIAQWVWVLRKGRVAFAGRVDDLQDSEVLRSAYFGEVPRAGR